MKNKKEIRVSGIMGRVFQKRERGSNFIWDVYDEHTLKHPMGYRATRRALCSAAHESKRSGKSGKTCNNACIQTANAYTIHNIISNTFFHCIITRIVISTTVLYAIKVVLATINFAG